MDDGNSAVQSPRSRLSYSAIAKYAEAVAKDNAVLAANGRVDVHALLGKLGGTIAIDDGSESLTIRTDDDFTVHIPTHTSGLRDRFTVAHELGHYFLHYRAPEQLIVGKRLKRATRMGRNVSETQANVFASNLLMPAEEFTQAFRENDSSISRVARIFEVSIPAAQVRADFLKLT